MALPACRLSFVFAKDAPIAVVLRRGPRSWIEVVKWNTAKDSFEDGQWLHGRIYTERCGLSPDGKLFVYFARKFGKIDRNAGYECTFTAVSKPPYLTALALLPDGGMWGGGGRFIDNTTLRLAYGANGTRSPDKTTRLYMPPMRSHHPSHSPRDLTIQTDLDYYEPDPGFRSGVGASDADWFGKDHSGRIIYTRGGVLFYVNKNRREAVLRDFRGDQFREVPPPRRAQSW